MDRAIVSIITVALNGGETIERTIQSVLMQTYPHIEYLVIDGGSTDKTLSILERYSNRLRYISEPDKGIYDAMNKGITLATGDIIGILNSDDWYEPNAVTEVVHASIMYPDVDVFHGLLSFHDKQGIREITGHDHGFLKLGMIEHPTCFLRKKVYEDVGLFDTEYQSAADYDLMLRVAQSGKKFHLIQKILANFRSGGISSSFRGAKETLKIKRRYHIISASKELALRIYWWFKI